MKPIYRLRSAGAKRALSNHTTRAATINAGKRRILRAKRPLDVDKCVKPAKGRATCETVAQIQAVERTLKSGRTAKTARVMTMAKAAPKPAGATVEVLNGARLKRRR